MPRQHHHHVGGAVSAAVHALAVAVAAFVICASAAAAIKVSFVSDVHYDPAYGTANAHGTCNTTSASPFGQPGCDSPAALLAVATSDIMMQRPAYTFFAGDWQRHGMSSTSLTTTDVFEPLSQYFARIMDASKDPSFNRPHVTTVLGNNDVIPNYYFNITTTPHTTLNTQIDIMKHYKLLNTTQGTVMSECGYYSGIASAHLRVLGVHTLVWTYNLSPALSDTETDPCGQLAWMESEINAARAAGQKVIIIGHIPPQPDVFRIINRGAVGPVEDDMYWKPMYQNAYTSLLSKNKDIIALQLFGHSHRFAILGDEEMGVPLIVINAMTPLYGNRPAYLIGDFDTATWKLKALRQRFAQTAFIQWSSGLEVAAALGITDFSNVSAIHAAVAKMFTNDTLFENYMTLRTGGVIDDPCTTTFCRVYTVCAMLYAAHDNINSCVRSQIPSSSSSSSEPTDSSDSAPTPDPSVHIDSKPQYHIRPPKNWINDPTGPYRDPVTGKIHLYMQYNPNGPLWGDIAWYHVTSEDYVKWTIPSTPIAMYADRWYDKWGAYSGTMMSNKYSEPVMMYTCTEPENIQRQCVATISPSDLAGKRTLSMFEKNPLNPILTEESVPGLVGLGNFRDPTEWWRDPANPSQWLIAFAARVKDSDGDNAHIVLFSTTDPSFQSGYSFSHSLYVYKYNLDHMFESPDFFTLKQGGEHYLKVSSMASHRDYIVYGSYQANPATGKYVFVEDPARSFTFIDYGPFYASKTFYDPILKRRMMWGWTNDELSNEQIASQGWSGVQNLLRGIEYDSVEQKIKTYPVTELKGLRLSRLYSRPETDPLVLVDGAPQILITAGTNATRQHEIIVTFKLSSMEPFKGNTYYTESAAPDFGVMIRTNANLSQYTTVSVRMPEAVRQPISNRAQDTTWAPIKMYPGAGANAVSNCSAECAKERTCVSWTYTTLPSSTCALYWKTSRRVYNATAHSGTVNIPLLYMDRTHSGSIGSSQPLLGRSPVKQTNPNVVRLHIFVDDSVIEVFKDGGLETMTGRLYLPGGESQTGIAVYSKNMGSVTVTASAEIFSMDSAFAAEAGPNLIRNYANSYYNLLTALGVAS
ncbi:beta-fructofuranosidase-like protein [Leishmania major strain Friedlin]|uniref:Beta-fructofuranosidase-like protein n=1 Tax=Leishmania major TaxID=5664 RepID=E9AEN9_LEIMA|nr:beta-fructofuranosidase-like protein [Leishmania major strain Friedlin]CAG9582415.1 beta-fructofuranosidase_-_putative [Leishmania major strain Friedlin]CBZ12692.1 beta-fructofuranosidase-like protein [Leishmania major strain Friedlin]|eukprot:XP_003722459.1 beta-fructofuranosidase-like protein [Leishmania major strain Friedlin]